MVDGHWLLRWWRCLAKSILGCDAIFPERQRCGELFVIEWFKQITARTHIERIDCVPIALGHEDYFRYRDASLAKHGEKIEAGRIRKFNSQH
jgi:hypothetical protein